MIGFNLGEDELEDLLEPEAESKVDSLYDTPSYGGYTTEYVEGADGFIGTQRPDTAQGMSDYAGNSFAAPGV